MRMENTRVPIARAACVALVWFIGGLCATHAIPLLFALRDLELDLHHKIRNKVSEGLSGAGWWEEVGRTSRCDSVQRGMGMAIS